MQAALKLDSQAAQPENIFDREDVRATIEGLENILKFSPPARREPPAALVALPVRFLSLYHIELDRAFERIYAAADDLQLAERRARNCEVAIQTTITRCMDSLRHKHDQLQALEARARSAEARSRDLGSRVMIVEVLLSDIFALASKCSHHSF